MNTAKTLATALTFMTALCVIIVAASAETTVQDETSAPVSADSKRSPNYVDTNKDGVCDNRRASGDGSAQGPGFVDADKDGVCDNRSSGAPRNGKGRFARDYVDADNDGVCDNWKAASCGRGKGRGCGGRGFSDADNDGICDNRTAGSCGGQGKRQRNFADADNNGVCDNLGAVKQDANPGQDTTRERRNGQGRCNGRGHGRLNR